MTTLQQSSLSPTFSEPSTPTTTERKRPQPPQKRTSLNLVFDALRAALASERSVFDECKFMNEKTRRKSSVDKIFRGDHCAIGGNPAVLKLLKQYDDRAIEFSGVVTHIRADMRMVEMMFVLTDKSIHFLDSVALRAIQRVPLASISAVTMSRLTDNFFALHGPEEDLLLVSWQKTEIVSTLTDITHPRVAVRFVNRFDVRFAPGLVREIVFKDSPTVSSPRFRFLAFLEKPAYHL
ncbi:myosin tail-domain-containing protein [Endogone sp. FLAS-F59071]|nr:myosin tail-domain-containing protein [Endogone sp. FLAS-F59071]|eukprot:RUS13361.1 myosin tail-domain-containing protein [Endogone sp. FLAS-F59071]